MARPRKGAVSFATIAEHFGVSSQAVGRWSRNGCPLESIEAVKAWRVAQQQRTADLTEAKVRKLQLECQRLETLIEREHGELIEKAEVDQAGQRLVELLADEVQIAKATVPGLIVGLPDENAVRAILDARFNRLLANFKARAVA